MSDSYQEKASGSDVASHSSQVSTFEEEKSIGVEKAELLAAAWDNKFYYKIILLFSSFLVGYGYGLDGQTRYVFTGYATQSYAEHSLLSTVNVITGVAAAASQPVYARLSDVFGRLELFIVSVVFYVVGTIIESQATSVQKYAGGAILYQIGYSGVILVLLLILSDFSSLRWRLFYTFVPAFPFIINTWISGNVTAAIGMNWSWGVGMWAFIFPLCCIPLVCCMIHMRYLAGKTPEWKVFKQRKTKYQELGPIGFANYLFWKLDIIGLLLLIVCLACILVPLTLAGGVKDTWKKAHIIVPIVIGGVLLPVFVAWETYGARFPLAPWKLLKDRGIWSALIISFLLDFISSIESSYLYTVLMVAVNESQKSATRITSISSFVSVVGAVFFGLVIVKFRKLKGFIVLGCSLWLVAFGIMYYYRGNLAAHSGIIGGLVVLGLGTTFFSYPINVSVQACVTHEHMATVSSLVYTTYRIGYAAGSSVAGAIWTQTLYSKLYNALQSTELATSVYTQPYIFITEYAWGTPVREAVVEVYREMQRILMIACMCFTVPMIIAALFLRDPKLGVDQSNDLEKLDANEGITDFFKFKKSKLEKQDQPVV
ncbi:major facilitator superfamily domain-containing protein [Scheffersomyces amazonensis]|uniref:major facilitator superfamily domain-containing protein n=1 Tax=Scheffersomyces amazonensis TaxID=1078765 RepID=UPI00315C7BEB